MAPDSNVNLHSHSKCAHRIVDFVKALCFTHQENVKNTFFLQIQRTRICCPEPESEQDRSDSSGCDQLDSLMIFMGKRPGVISGLTCLQILPLPAQHRGHKPGYASAQQATEHRQQHQFTDPGGHRLQGTC